MATTWRIQRRTLQRFLALGLLASIALLRGDVSAELRKLFDGRVVGPVAASTNSDDDPTFNGGAALKTDPDLEQLLHKADLFAADGRYDLACVLWQRVLNEAGGTVMTRDEWTMKKYRRAYRRYRSVIGEIEQTIAKLPDGGLKTYRITADGEAQALLAAAEGENEEEALAQITQRFFMSSLGDDAALRLASLRMDRHDFVGADRLLNKILDEFPDPSVSRQDVLLRLAVARSRVGDAEAAQSALDELKRAGTSDRLLSRIEADFSRAGVAKPHLAGASRDWPMPLGNSARTGHMQSLPLAVTKTTLSELWTEPHEIDPAPSGGGQYPFPVYKEIEQLRRSVLKSTEDESSAAMRKAMIARWTNGAWAPAGDVLLSDGQVYFKSIDRLMCRDLQSCDLQWMGRENRFQLDQLSQMAMQRGQQVGQPANFAEMMLFGDRIQQGMTIDSGVVYNIEGTLAGEYKPAPNQQRAARYGYGGTAPRTRRNWLCAYNAKSGKMLWRRSAAGAEQESKFE
ncbi:MAG: hypothetical protein KDA41_05605, partial [Planctomycetales bacterium]|nr:hypothetical protein [Planctomycetales bacterium]